MKRLTFNDLDNIISHDKNLNRNSNQTNKCYVHDFVQPREIDEIHEKVCVNDLPLVQHSDGKEYCLFHYPTNEKNPTMFKEKFAKRLDALERTLTDIGLYPVDQQEKLKTDICYDFRYVWFPIEIEFTEYEFLVDCNFKMAVFSRFAFFDEANFFGKAYFTSSSFLMGAFFGFSKFSAKAYFNNAKFFSPNQPSACVSFISTQFLNSVIFSRTLFLGKAGFEDAVFNHTDFDGAIFTEYANFSSSIFFADASFNETNFLNEASFSKATFEDTSQISFISTFFIEDVYFNKSVVKGYLYFESGNGKHFKKLNKENKITSEPLERFTTVFEKSLDFSHVRAINPERVTFNKVRLRPIWFLHTDSRKFIFTDIQWETHKGGESEIKNELKGLADKSFEKPHIYKLLAVSLRYLASNAEDFNRFDESSNFRRMAFETEWLEKKEKISNWIKNLIPESEKLKRRFGGSDKEEDKPIPPTNSFGILRRSGDFFIHGLYRITSFYGESWSWALGVLLSLILLIFPIIYTQINFQTCSKDRPIAASLTVCESKDEEIRKNCTCSTDQITFTDAIVQSLTTATLQNVEYRKPLTVWGELWIILEKIFAPLQAALLALAIRRKFMR